MQTLEQHREQDRRTEAVAGPTGLGGWLILPTLGMFLTPVIWAIGLPEYFPFFAGETALNATQTTLVWFEVIGNSLIQIVAPIVLLAFFFQKKSNFPLLFIGWSLANIVFVLVDLVFAYNAFRAYYESPGVEFWDRDTVQSVSRAVIHTAIWVPYMMSSRRVKNTFLN